MEALKKHTGIASVLNRANIDTDQIIPKQFLKSIERTGFGEHLFEDWRYLPDGSINNDFELNNKCYEGTSILVTGNNFGCGSSREHAVWAVYQFGLRVIIAPRMTNGKDEIPGFADIFKNNCVKNSVLTIELSDAEVKQIREAIESEPGSKISADLENQVLTIHTSNEFQINFKTDPGTRERLLNGLDDIGLTLQVEDKISQFEKTHQSFISK